MLPTETPAATAALRLDQASRASLRRWARDAYPHEACGLLVGRPRVSGGWSVSEVRRARNLEAERTNDRYVLDPEAFLAADRDARAAGLEVVGFWHSHPDSPAVPSDTDRGAAWPGYAYVIVSVHRGRPLEVRVWALADDSFHERRLIP